jgi:hypothetical protein
MLMLKVKVAWSFILYLKWMLFDNSETRPGVDLAFVVESCNLYLLVLK